MTTEKKALPVPQQYLEKRKAFLETELKGMPVDALTINSSDAQALHKQLEVMIKSKQIAKPAAQALTKLLRQHKELMYKIRKGGVSGSDPDILRQLANNPLSPMTGMMSMAHIQQMHHFTSELLNELNIVEMVRLNPNSFSGNSAAAQRLMLRALGTLTSLTGNATNASAPTGALGFVVSLVDKGFYNGAPVTGARISKDPTIIGKYTALQIVGALSEELRQAVMNDMLTGAVILSLGAHIAMAFSKINEIIEVENRLTKARIKVDKSGEKSAAQNSRNMAIQEKKLEDVEKQLAAAHALRDAALAAKSKAEFMKADNLVLKLEAQKERIEHAIARIEMKHTPVTVLVESLPDKNFQDIELRNALVETLYLTFKKIDAIGLLIQASTTRTLILLNKADDTHIQRIYEASRRLIMDAHEQGDQQDEHIVLPKMIE